MMNLVEVADGGTSEEESTSAPTERALVAFRGARYVGGHPRLGPPSEGEFVVTSSCLGIGYVRWGPVKACRVGRAVRFSSISSVEVFGDQVAKSRLPAVLAFGVLGGLAAKGSKYETTVIVHTNDGETAYFTIDEESPTEVLAQLVPTLRKFGVPFLHGTESRPVDAQSAAASELAQQIRELAALRDDGLITGEEFDIQKLRILGIDGA